MSASIAIEFHGGMLKPGDQVAGTVQVLESVKSKELTIALEYREITPDYRIAAKVIKPDTPLHTGPVESGDSFSFTLALPADALPNQTGKVGTTAWGLHARLARFGPDAHAWQQLAVPGPDRAVRA